MNLVARGRGMAKHIEVIYTNGVFRPLNRWNWSLQKASI